MDVDPDSRARTHLANERTFLAWFRTGITMVALGFAAAQLLGQDRPGQADLVRALATLVMAVGAVAVGVGLVRYRGARRQIDAQGYAPAWTSITLTAAAGLVLAVLAIGIVWLLGPA